MSLRKIIRNILKETYGYDAVQYSAVVIEDSVDEQKIRELSKQYVPEGWSEPPHYHMTIGQGSIPQSLRLRGDLNQEVELTIDMIGMSDKAIAFGTFGYYSKNEMPHITIAFNKDAGGAPADSKDIDNWKPIEKIKVTGVIREIGGGNKVINAQGEIDEMLGYKTMTTTTSRLAHPGIPAEFPKPENFDQFGNDIEKTSI